MVLYQGRHSGASLDASRRLRSIEEIQKRGRWKTARSVSRYERGGRLQDTWRSLTAAQKTHFEACERVLESVVLHDTGYPAVLGQ